MPAKLNNKQTRVVRAEVTEEFTDVKIKSYNMDDEIGKLTIVYRNILDGKNIGGPIAEEFSGVDLADIILGNPSPGKNRREDNKTVLYDLLLNRLGYGAVVS